ncbi:MAG: carbohydrate kinase family protein [Candidatus Zixiibacteriota bacterium]
MVRSSSSDRIEFDCLGFGMNVVDYLSILDPYPNLDEKVEVVESATQGGGPVPTAMVALARLGAKVAYVGKIGDDPEGRFVKAELEKEGVNTDYLIMDKESRTAKAFIWVDKNTGKRTVALDRTKSNHIKIRELRFIDSISTRFLHLDAREPEADIFLAKWAKKLGAKVSLDVGSLRSGEEHEFCVLRSVFPFVNHLLVSKRFACGFTRLSDPFLACKELMKKGFEIVGVTIGEDGCICGSPRGFTKGGSGGEDRIFHTPGFPVKVVDTTGAGDVFHGAFIHGLLEKWDLKKTARFACATAAMKCRKLGGRAGIPNLAEVTDFMESFKK